MPDEKREVSQCPFCRQAIKAGAIRCKHCFATIPPTKPDHEGICPFCKEDIDKEATRCMHCKANLDPVEQRFNVQAQPPVRRIIRRQISEPVMFGREVPFPGNRVGATRARARSADPGCADYDIDDAGTWCFVESSEHYCIYELCEPAPVSPYTVFR